MAVRSSLRYGSASITAGHGPSPSGKKSVADSSIPSAIGITTSSRRVIVARRVRSDPRVEPHDRAPMQHADATRGQHRPEPDEDRDGRDHVGDDERSIDERGRDRRATGLGVDRDVTGLAVSDYDRRVGRLPADVRYGEHHERGE